MSTSITIRVSFSDAVYLTLISFFPFINLVLLCATRVQNTLVVDFDFEHYPVSCHVPFELFSTFTFHLFGNIGQDFPRVLPRPRTIWHAIATAFLHCKAIFFCLAICVVIIERFTLVSILISVVPGVDSNWLPMDVVSDLDAGFTEPDA